MPELTIAHSNWNCSTCQDEVQLPAVSEQGCVFTAEKEKS